ncbi:hypothetical protein BC941DRAFT_456891 [Chlamydoabsidia padenii]|nr:hypothetical protein BC941DRAFT_456891 [Chlamydoabsidia padenii]
MFKQVSFIGLLALAVPSVFGDLLSYNGQSCGGVSKVHRAGNYCLRLHGDASHRVANGRERGWYIYPNSNCSGHYRYLVLPEQGCVDQHSYGFTAFSASPYHG